MELEIMEELRIYEWMQLCLECINKINNNEFNDEDGTSNNNNNNNDDEDLDIYMILESFIIVDEPSVMEIDIYAPFGPGERLTAENYFF